MITWRPLETADLEGYDANATLEMRANNIMSGICKDFCQWLDTLGGSDKTVDEEVLKDMFEIDFNADACRSMQVKEIRILPGCFPACFARSFITGQPRCLFWEVFTEAGN